MTGPPRWIAGAIGAMLAVLTVVVLVAPRLLHVMPPRNTARHAAVLSLPPGVCPLSTESWSADSESTRVEAKLVTYDSLVSSDPDFSWLKEPLPASSTRTTPATTTPPYYWVIASIGNYSLDGVPRPPMPAPPTGTRTFHVMWIYLRADDCVHGGTIRFPANLDLAPNDGWPTSGLHADGSGWPAWFDQMPGLAHVKIR